MEVWENLLYLGVQASPDNSLCFLTALCFSSRRCFSLAEASICKINSGNCKKMIFQDIGKKKQNKIFSSDLLTHRNRGRHNTLLI